MYKKGKSKTHLVHRLVGLAFLENIDNNPIIDHIDGDPTNNNINNLRWASYGQNAWNTKSSNPYGCGASGWIYMICMVFSLYGHRPIPYEYMGNSGFVHRP